MPNLYASLDDIKHPNRLNITDSVADDMLTDNLEEASRTVDDDCHRWFFCDSTEVSRYYTALSPDKIFVDDIASPTSDVTVEIDINGDGVIDTTFAATDFILAPYNAELNGEPYQKIEAIGQFSFPVNVRRGVKVTSKWGWVSVPPKIKEATLLKAQRIFKRNSTILGSEAMTALGKQTLVIPATDADYRDLISRYIKPVWG